jgi:hypothetical protein
MDDAAHMKRHASTEETNGESFMVTYYWWHVNSNVHKRGLTSWRGGRGRSGLLSLETETWHIANENHLLEGRKREERVHEPGNTRTY